MGDYLEINSNSALLVNFIQENVDKAALQLCNMHLTLDHATLWLERFNKVKQLTRSSVTNAHIGSH